MRAFMAIYARAKKVIKKVEKFAKKVLTALGAWVYTKCVPRKERGKQ